jgi:hypothetical protein
MLRLRIEYVPFGDEARAETLETVEIVNDGQRLGSGMGDYDVYHRMDDKLVSRARVTGHVRREGALKLAALAIGALEEGK